MGIQWGYLQGGPRSGPRRRARRDPEQPLNLLRRSPSGLYRVAVSATWTPLSLRTDRAQPLRDGLPRGLVLPLRAWIANAAGKGGSRITERTALRCDVDLSGAWQDNRDAEEQKNVPFEPDLGGWLAYEAAPRRLLDIIDALLDELPTEGWLLTPQPKPGQSALGRAARRMRLAYSNDRYLREPLESLLEDARSVYTISADGRALVRRIDPVAAALLDQAAEEADGPGYGNATDHLNAARLAAYALTPDPVKAYSEAIKAVEAAAHAAIQPKHMRATLGTMLGELTQARHKFTSAIPGGDGSDPVALVVQMMRVLWEGQTSRHGHQDGTRPETPESTVAAVHLAGTLVQWFASGAVRRN